MLDGRNNRFFFPWEQMFFLMQIIFIVLPFNMAAVQNLYRLIFSLNHHEIVTPLLPTLFTGRSVTLSKPSVLHKEHITTTVSIQASGIGEPVANISRITMKK